MTVRSHILELPRELRTRIYEACFDEIGSRRVVHVPADWDDEMGTGPWFNRQPPITLVNRQIRAESL